MDINSTLCREYIKKRENPIIFSKDHKFVYFPVNKVMQTTITNSCDCIIYKRNPSKWLEYFEKTNFNEVYKFGITRNPLDKFESAFNYLKNQKNYQLGWEL